MWNYISTGICFIVLVVWYNRVFGERKSKLRDGSYLVHRPGIPFFGVALEMNPQYILEYFQSIVDRYGNFVELIARRRKILLISDPEITKEILSARPRLFRRGTLFDYGAIAGNVHHGLFFANGAAWATSRKFTAPSFNKLNVNNHTQTILGLTHHWTQHLKCTNNEGKANTPIEFKAVSLQLTLNVITKVAFGIDPSDTENYLNSKQFLIDLHTLLTFMMKVALFPLPKPWFKYSPDGSWEIRAIEGMKRFDTAMMEVITQRRKQLQSKDADQSAGTPCMPPSLLDTLLRKQENETFTDEELLHNVKTFYVAGSDTTAIINSLAVRFLATDQNAQERVREEANNLFEKRGKSMTEISIDDVMEALPFTESVVKETLRLCPPGSFLGYQLEAGIPSHTLSNGIVLDKGTTVLVNLDAIHHNDKYFIDAKAFKPERWLVEDKDQRVWNDSYLFSFGYGPRVCVGQRLAMLELIIATAMIVYEFDIKLGCDSNEIRRILKFVAAPEKVPVILTSIR